MRNENPFIGNTLDDFLNEEGILAECEAEAIKRIVARQLSQYMQERNPKKTEFAIDRTQAARSSTRASI